MFNANWPLWIIRSVTKHFTSSLSAYTTYVEGTTRKTSALEQFFELRVDGPDSLGLTKGQWRLDIVVNILIQVAVVDRSFNNDDKLIGLATAAMTAIDVYRYGDGVDDDDTLLGCLQRVSGPEAHKFGILKPELKVIQATVESMYSISLTE